MSNYHSHMPSPEQYLRSLENQPELPRSPKGKWWKKVAAIMCLIAGLLALYVAINLLRLSSNPFAFDRLKGESQGRVNILLLGVGDPGHAGQNLSDTNMVVSINTRDKQVAMISLPRDLRVYLPGHGYGKLNLAHAQGGPDKSRQVVEQTLGIPIHYYAKVNFTGLREVVDAVGGVNINVTEALYDPEYPCDNNQYRNCGMTIKKGQQHMDGKTALKYVRCRKGNCGDDFGRAKRQQEVLLAVREKALSLGTLANPVKINELSVALGDNIDTDLSVSNGVSLAKMAKEIGPDRTFSIVFSLDDGGFLSSSAGDLVPIGGSFADIQAFVKDVFKLGPIWIEDASLAIENGTSTPGLGARVRDQISDEGYRVTVQRLTNAPQISTASQIIDYSGGKKPHTVRYLEALLGVKAVAAQTRNPQVDIKVVVGEDYAARTPAQQE
jgi:LCP family protein required for cell wall assembly